MVTAGMYTLCLYLLFIRYESPEVYLDVVSVHLHLLQTKLAKCPQTHALQESLHENVTVYLCVYV